MSQNMRITIGLDKRRRTDRTRVGALLPMPSCLGISSTLVGPSKDTHNTTSDSTEGSRGWPDRRVTRHHNDTTKGVQRFSGVSSSNTKIFMAYVGERVVTPICRKSSARKQTYSAINNHFQKGTSKLAASQASAGVKRAWVL